MHIIYCLIFVVYVHFSIFFHIRNSPFKLLGGN
nr:MAG TPA: hypothetical protein [Caudoviricetes sp.]